MSIEVVIEGYGGRYSCNDKGEIFSNWSQGKFKKCFRKKKMASTFLKNGYSTVTMFDDGKRKTRYTHRIIGEAFHGKSECYDHINGDKKNNNAKNIRALSRHEKGGKMSIVRKSGKSSKYKGVSWSKRDNVFRAQIMINDKNTFLGQSTNELECALWYDKAALKTFGEYAVVNFPKKEANNGK